MSRLDPVTGLKVCTRCKEKLSAEAFTVENRRVDGLCIWCRECMSIRRKEKENATHVKAVRAIWRKNNPEGEMLRAARDRARKKGIPCTITVDDINIPDVCPLPQCARPLERNKGKGPTNSSPTLDQYDPILGYVPGNVWVICLRCNRRKQDVTGEELVAFGLELIGAFKEGKK